MAVAGRESDRAVTGHRIEGGHRWLRGPVTAAVAVAQDQGRPSGYAAHVLRHSSQGVVGPGGTDEIDPAPGEGPHRGVGVLVPQPGDGPPALGIDHLLGGTSPEGRSDLGDLAIDDAQVDRVAAAPAEPDRHEPDGPQQQGEPVGLRS